MDESILRRWKFSKEDAGKSRRTLGRLSFADESFCGRGGRVGRGRSAWNCGSLPAGRSGHTELIAPNTPSPRDKCSSAAIDHTIQTCNHALPKYLRLCFTQSVFSWVPKLPFECRNVQKFRDWGHRAVSEVSSNNPKFLGSYSRNFWVVLVLSAPELCNWGFSITLFVKG